VYLGVGEANWVFKTSFEVTAEQLKDPEIDLVFEGLDTYCDIVLVSTL
jgi:beta-mannosidase